MTGPMKTELSFHHASCSHPAEDRPSQAHYTRAELHEFSCVPAGVDNCSHCFVEFPLHFSNGFFSCAVLRLIRGSLFRIVMACVTDLVAPQQPLGIGMSIW